MKVLIVIAHPDRNSVDHSKLISTIRFQYKKLGHTVEVLDLYDIGYNPSTFVGDISHINNNAFAKSFRHSIKTAKHIWIISPTRWLSLDPLMEGFIDQVFIKGFAYDDTGVLLGNRKCGVIVTSTQHKSLNWKTLGILWIRLRLIVFPTMFKFKNIKVLQIWNIKKLNNLELNKHLFRIKNTVNNF